MFSVLATGVGAFIMSNISFVWAGTPFSASENMLYVRTLVDFGGMLMLMTEMGRRNELSIKNENDAINLLFRRQYEQYKLAIDNSEALRKEIHDMKHYVAALKSEDDPKKRAEVLDDMEQAIAIQESFMNTGNQVLDVILTTKSLQCAKKEITLNAMVDGPSLAGIHVKDICSLFGNLLDNAIEATQQTENVSKRLITLSVRKEISLSLWSARIMPKILSWKSRFKWRRRWGLLRNVSVPLKQIPFIMDMG
jgi:signal transduction histidine kinase